MHKNHLVGCGIGVAVALAVVVLSGGSAGSIGVLFAALLCPLIMIGAMWLLMGNDRHDRNATPAPPPAADTTSTASSTASR